MRIIQDKGVQASAAAAVVVGVTASIGAERYPLGFAIVGLAWAAITAYASANAVRKSRA